LIGVVDNRDKIFEIERLVSDPELELIEFVVIEVLLLMLVDDMFDV
jgi:hypothetical protein